MKVPRRLSRDGVVRKEFQVHSRMNKDILFLLQPGFHDGDAGPFFCPDCASLRGVIGFYPRLEEELEIRIVDFARPRLDLRPFTGESAETCPVLILSSPSPARLEGIDVQVHHGHRFINEPDRIVTYPARAYRIGLPH